jgi:predicted amidohydrolase
VNVIGLQFDISWEDKAANFATVRRLLSRRWLEPGALVVLPEMFATGFSMNAEGIAEAAGGSIEQFLSTTAREHGVFVLGGAAVRGQDGKARNKALVFGPSGDLAGFYAKMRPFSVGAEDEHYVAGKEVVVVDCGACKIAPFVCYDLRFPELFRRAALRDRPELFAVIANFPAKRIQHWVKLLQARAIENQAYVVGVNRIGTDPVCAYNGRSVVVDPQGELVADAGEEEAAISAKLDLEALRQYRAGMPFLDDLEL